MTDIQSKLANTNQRTEQRRAIYLIYGETIQVAPELLQTKWRGSRDRNPVDMPSFADALNRIGFFYLLNCLMADSRPSMVNGYI